MDHFETSIQLPDLKDLSRGFRAMRGGRQTWPHKCHFHRR